MDEETSSDGHTGTGVPPGEGPVCRLTRKDRSAWRVDDLTFTRRGLKVDAERITTDGSRGASLEGAFLEAGDRLEWLDDEGRVVWAHRNPVDGG